MLNLLLPEVFDNHKTFHDWFSKPLCKVASSHNSEDEWLETEKKVIIIHRLHQILEPFVLRRRVEDVEGALPPKVLLLLSIIIHHDHHHFLFCYEIDIDGEIFM